MGLPRLVNFFTALSKYRVVPKCTELWKELTNGSLVKLLFQQPQFLSLRGYFLWVTVSMLLTSPILSKGCRKQDKCSDWSGFQWDNTLQLPLMSSHQSSVTKMAEMVQGMEYYLLDDLEVLWTFIWEKKPQGLPILSLPSWGFMAGLKRWGSQWWPL